MPFLFISIFIHHYITVMTVAKQKRGHARIWSDEMTTTISAVRLEANGNGPDKVGDPFKVTVRLRIPVDSLNQRTEVLVRLYRVDEENPFAIVPFQKPRGFDVNDSNWYQLLECEQQRDVKSFYPTVRVNVDDRSLLPTKVSWDHRLSPFLVIRLPSGERYGLYVRNWAGHNYAELSASNVTFIKKEFERPVVSYTERNLKLCTATKSDRLRLFETRILPLKRFLSPNEMLVNYFTNSKNHTFSADDFLVESTSIAGKAIYPRAFHGFEYFITANGEYAFTLQKEPVFRAFKAIVKHIEGLGSSFSVLAARHQTLLNDIINIVDDENPNKTAEFLEYVVDAFEGL